MLGPMGPSRAPESPGESSMESKSPDCGPPSAPPAHREHRRWSTVGGITWLLCAAAAPLAAQVAAGPTPASAEASLAITSLRDEATWLASASALLGLPPRLSLGGAGSVVLGATDLAGSVPGSDLELRVAFGGLLAQLLVLESGERSVWLRLLAGAGNAKVDLAAVGTQIAADNFGVLVPEIAVTVKLVGPLRGGAAVGYRTTFGVEDLPGVAPSDLRGLAAGVSLSLHRF